MSERIKSISQLAEMFDMDRATIRKKLKALQPFKVEAKRTLYEVPPAARLILGLDAETENIDQRLIEEQLRYEKARADKMILEVEQRRGEVVPTSEVARIVGNEYSNVRARILSIPSRCAKDLSLETNPSMVKHRLEEEIHEALAELTADEKFEENQHVEQSNSNTEADSTEDVEAAAKVKPG